MGSDLHTALEVLHASVIEGRAENVRYRQNELYSLHSALRENADGICEAIAKEYAESSAKGETEFFMAIDAVRISYENLDFDRALAEEYSVKHGKDNTGRRAPLGLVAIRPSRHSRLYSILSLLAAALEAGNCILIEVSHVFSNEGDFANISCSSMVLHHRWTAFFSRSCPKLWTGIFSESQAPLSAKNFTVRLTTLLIL